MKFEFILKNKIALGFLSKKNAVLILFTISCFNFCKSSHETFVEEIQELVEQEKYEKASERLKEKLQSPKERDELLSKEVPDSARIIEFSNDRLKLVWTEDQKIFFRTFRQGKIIPEVWIRFLPIFLFLKTRITLWWNIRCRLPEVADMLQFL
ncbi:putative lipoprotein [Leptospira borgpetersenii str. Noumea 25]|nr:putative lipoprotein [Leptospira borgpetersenii str. Noumea 25]